MSFNYRIRTVFYDPAGQKADNVLSYDADQPFGLNASIPNGGYYVIPFVLDVSTVLALMLVSTKTITVYTNAESPGQDATVALTANVPKMWSADVGGSNPFGATDIVTLHVNNVSTGTAVLQIYGGRTTLPVAES